MRFLERIVDESNNNNQDCSTTINEKSLESDSNNNINPQCSTPCQLPRTDANNSSDNQNLICQFCNRRFIRRKSFDLHVESHTQPRRYKCDECAEIFTTNKRLMVHTTTTHGKGVIYSCYLCKNFFTSRDSLRLHMNLKHTGRLLRRCTVCARGFSATNHLTRHMQSHANRGSFECNVCLLRFKLLSGLNRHKTKMHTIGCKNQNFRTERLPKQPMSLTLCYRSGKTCLLCSKEFSTTSIASRHINAVHTKEKTYDCKICPKKYYYLDTLRKHVKTHTIDSRKCE